MTKNYAHRGFSGMYPENTMLAFKKAVEAGCDGIEHDVHLTKDGELVIIHDERVDRTTDGKGLVSQYTLEELKRLNAAVLFPEFGVQEIPTLREYFEYVKDLPIMTNIELKTGVDTYPGIEQKVYDMIMAYDLKEKIIISSFNHYSVLRMKAIDPEMVCGFLEESWIIDAGAYAAKHGVECWHPLFNTLTEENVAELRANNLQINCWTVNEEEDIRRMIDLGIDIVIGNYPDKVRAILAERG